jgi:hypothetical protein
MYEAGPGQVFSIDEDEHSAWLGTFQEQSARPLKAMHVKRGPLRLKIEAMHGCGR